MTDSKTWFKVLHFFLEKYGKGPDFIAGLTLDQFLIYINEGKDPDESLPDWVDPKLARALIKAKRG